MAMNEFRYLQLYVKCMKIFGRCPLQPEDVLSNGLQRRYLVVQEGWIFYIM